MMDIFKLAPTGLSTWVSSLNKSPGMVNLRQNKAYAHEVARRLIEDKRQELKTGTTRRDLLSLLGSSRLAFKKLDIRYNISFQSRRTHPCDKSGD